MNDGQPSDVRLLKVVEVAAILRVSKMTVYRMISSGELPVIKVRGSFRVPMKAIEEFLRQI